MGAAIGPVSMNRVGNTPIKLLGAFVKTAEEFDKGWMLMRDSSGLFVEASVATTLLPGGFADRALLGDDAPSGDDTDLINVETGIYSVPMLSTSTFAVTDKPGPIYAHNNREFAKSSSGRSIAGLFICLDDEFPTARCVAWIGPEGAAIAKGIADAAALATSGTFICDEWTDASAVSTTALKAATTFTTDPQTILAAALTSSGGTAALAAYPRNVTFTGGGTTGHCPTQVVITGTDINDDSLSETLALSSGSGTGVKAFKTIVSFVFTGATSNDGTVACGIGKKFGLSRPIKQRIGLPHVIQELAINAVVTTGTYVAAATSPPNGTYAPSANPDGSNDYALTYEQDV
jgi:hypothetical protein